MHRISLPPYLLLLLLRVSVSDVTYSHRDVIDDAISDAQMSSGASNCCITTRWLYVCLQYILLLCFLLITEVVVTSIVTIFREKVRKITLDKVLRTALHENSFAMRMLSRFGVE